MLLVELSADHVHMLSSEAQAGLCPVHGMRLCSDCEMVRQGSDTFAQWMTLQMHVCSAEGQPEATLTVFSCLLP